ncbi:MAG: hypothetical protein ACXWPK_02145 [Isosphaeraceae bacterium]
MPMELLVSNNQGIANLAADDEKDDFGRFDVYIIQDPKVANAEFEFRQRIGAQPLDGSCRLGRVVSEPSKNRRLQDTLLPHR